MEIQELDSFLKKNSIGTKSFRYFNKRDFSVLTNHVCTFLYYLNNEVVGYGHLDYEINKIWLGIMVGDNHIGKGLGKIIINHLTQQTKEPIFLSVDQSNYKAQQLYNKVGFTIIEENNKHFIMMKTWQTL